MDCAPGFKTFPGFSEMYVLEEPRNSRAFRVAIGLPVDDAFSVTRAEKRLESVEARWAIGAAAPQDVIRATIAAPIVISARVLKVLRDGSFSGWRTYPINLIGKKGDLVGGYHGLAVHGRCGTINNSQSTKFHKIMPGGAFTWWRGLYFDPATWDGSDLFMPAGDVGWIFVVAAVKRAFEQAEVKNVTFTPLAHVERMKL